MNLLTDHRMWSEIVTRICGSAGDEAFYKCLGNELAFGLAEVTTDGRGNFRAQKMILGPTRSQKVSWCARMKWKISSRRRA